MERLKTLIKGTDLIVVPVALNAIMARLAEEAGFKAVYLSGGSLGWLKCVTEANLTLPEMAQVAVEMRSVCKAADRSRCGRRLGRSGTYLQNDRPVRRQHPPGPPSQRCTRPCASLTNRSRAERSIRFSAGAEPPAK